MQRFISKPPETQDGAKQDYTPERSSIQQLLTRGWRSQEAATPGAFNSSCLFVGIEFSVLCLDLIFDRRNFIFCVRSSYALVRLAYLSSGREITRIAFARRNPLILYLSSGHEITSIAFARRNLLILYLLTSKEWLGFIAFYEETLLKHGSNERDSSSSPERSSPVILSEAKDQRMSQSPEPFASLKGKLREGEAAGCRARQTLRYAQGDSV